MDFVLAVIRCRFIDLIEGFGSSSMRPDPKALIFLWFIHLQGIYPKEFEISRTNPIKAINNREEVRRDEIKL